MPWLLNLFGGMNLALPLIGAGLIALAIGVAWVSHSLQSYGAAQAELEYLSVIAQENQAASERYKASVETVTAQVREAEAKAQAAQRDAAQVRAKIRTAPKQGIGTVCPLDCAIPDLTRDGKAELPKTKKGD